MILCIIDMKDYELDLVLAVGGGRLPRPLDLDALQENLEGQFQKYGSQPGLYFKFDDDGQDTTFYEGDDEKGAPYIIRAPNGTALREKNERILNELIDIGVLTEEEADEMEVELYNHVAHGKLNKDLNLSTLTLALRTYDEDNNLKSKVEYEPEQFPPIVYFGHDSPCMSLIFSNGKVIIPGGKTKEECALTFRKLVEELVDRFPSRFEDPGEITFSDPN